LGKRIEIFLMMMMMMMSLKKDYKEGVTKSNPTQKGRPAKGISKRVDIPKTTRACSSKIKSGAPPWIAALC
jgi:hypothetical protein